MTRRNAVWSKRKCSWFRCTSNATRDPNRGPYLECSSKIKPISNGIFQSGGSVNLSSFAQCWRQMSTHAEIPWLLMRQYWIYFRLPISAASISILASLNIARLRNWWTNRWNFVSTASGGQDIYIDTSDFCVHLWIFKLTVSRHDVGVGFAEMLDPAIHPS